MSPRKKKIVIVILAVIVAFFIGIIGYQWSSRNAAGSNGLLGSSTSGFDAQGSPLFPSVTPVPPGSVAPNKGTTAAPAGVAVPLVQGPGDPGGDVAYRSFDITADGNAFSPSTVIVNQGDTVNLEVTAVDGDYAFTQPNYGFDADIKKGKTQRIQFQALQSGDFIFYCGSCGGPSAGPLGHLIVVATTTQQP